MVKSTRKQLAVLLTMESAAYYPCFDDPMFMQPFDLEISYRREVQEIPILLVSMTYPCLHEVASLDMYPADKLGCVQVCDDHSFCQQAQLPISYLRKDQIDGWRHDALVPFEKRSDSPVYVQSNCKPQTKRDRIVRNLMTFPDLNVRSFGR